jgi:hypothetical protein
MKKNTTTLLIVGALAVGGYLAYKKGMFGKKTETDETPDEAPEGEDAPTTTKGGGGSSSFATGGGGSTKGVTAILDIATSGKPLSDAIEKAKGIVEDYKAGRVIIKTEKGKKNISVTRKAKQTERKAKRTERKATVKTKRTERKATVKTKRTERKAKRTERKASRKAKTVGYSF